jgi:hypothetical protein
MENLLWILPLLICPLGMLAMAAVMWMAARLGGRSSEPAGGSAGQGAPDGPSGAAPDAA